MSRILLGVAVLALYLLTVATAVAQDVTAPAIVEVPVDPTSAIPWVTGATAVISSVLLVLREARSVVDKMHGCQPTVRILHTYEACPRCGARPGEADDHDEPRPAVRAATST
jgi:hypothetical protein